VNDLVVRKSSWTDILTCLGSGTSSSKMITVSSACFGSPTIGIVTTFFRY